MVTEEVPSIQLGPAAAVAVPQVMVLVDLFGITYHVGCPSIRNSAIVANFIGHASDDLLHRLSTLRFACTAHIKLRRLLNINGRPDLEDLIRMRKPLTLRPTGNYPVDQISEVQSGGGGQHCAAVGHQRVAEPPPGLEKRGEE